MYEQLCNKYVFMQYHLQYFDFEKLLFCLYLVMKLNNIGDFNLDNVQFRRFKEILIHSTSQLVLEFNLVQ